MGKSAELIVLKEPDYVRWLLKTQLSGPMGDIEQYAVHLVQKFDSKSIKVACHVADCDKTATCCTVYSDNVNSTTWWCDKCYLDQTDALSPKIQCLRTYRDAIAHVDSFRRGKKAALKTLISRMALARGLPKRVCEEDAMAFFK